VMLPVSSPLNAQLEHLSGFTRMDNPGERYRMYAVSKSNAFEPTPVVTANGDLNNEDWDAAIGAYTRASGDSTDDRFLTYLGLGRAYAEKGQYSDATGSYEAALKLDPKSSTIHDLLANAYGAAGEKDQAQTEYERAIELDPENMDLRLKYGQYLVPTDQQKAAEQYQAVVQMYPKVPDYRVKLGAALLLTGDTQAADEQFQSAVNLDPRSANLQEDLGNANLAIGHPERALGYYEEALKIDPNSQLYALNLGKTHAQLSTLNGNRDQGQFDQAETLLNSVENLSHLPWEADQREAAQIALGDLYLAWGRPEDAAAAYNRALELNPNSEEAKKKLGQAASGGVTSGTLDEQPAEATTPATPGASPTPRDAGADESVQ